MTNYSPWESVCKRIQQVAKSGPLPVFIHSITGAQSCTFVCALPVAAFVLQGQG